MSRGPRWGSRLALEPLDVWFALLRAAALGVGALWWALAPDRARAPRPAVLAACVLFSLGLYVVNVRWPGRIRMLYRFALAFDLLAVFLLIRVAGGYESDLYLAFVLMIALHAFYFGLATGLGVALVSMAAYALAVAWPPPVPGFLVRTGFFGLVGLCMGVVAEQSRQQRQVLERQQEQLIRSDRLATVGELAAGLAHELRNPLAGVAGALHVLGGRLAPDEDRRALLADVQAQIARMNRTLTDLLQHARPAAPQRIAVDVNGLLEQSLQFLPRSDIEVVRKLDTALPPLFVDPNLLHQAILNVLVNARQAMPTGGRLTVETRAARNGREVVEVVIGDTGVGIGPEALARIFQPFFTTKAQGTGLGLAIASRVIEQHGGRITVDSAPGQGSTFVLALPVAVGPDGGGDARS